MGPWQDRVTGPMTGEELQEPIVGQRLQGRLQETAGQRQKGPGEELQGPITGRDCMGPFLEKSYKGPFENRGHNGPLQEMSYKGLF